MICRYAMTEAEASRNDISAKTKISPKVFVPLLELKGLKI